MLKYLYLSILLLLSSISFAAQSPEEVKSDTLKFKDRLGFHTNTLGWLLLTPNVGVEYDIVRSDYKKVSLLLHGRFNGASNQDFSSRYVYNIAGLKAELRWYFRMRERQPWEKDLISSTEGFFRRLFARRRLLTSRENPRRYRAYYVGPYAGYDKFTLKYNSLGRQGNMMNFGVSLGYTTPLYIYANGTGIDLELGASIGAMYLGYDKFGYNEEDHCYVDRGEHKGALVPYPVISDLRLSLVYRMDPIRNQIKVYDENILEHDLKMYELRMKYIDNYDNIFGPDELPEGYNGKFAVGSDVATDSEEYKRAVKKYKDSIAETHKQVIAKMNREVRNKNARIKEINAAIVLAAGEDTTLLLDELRPAYNYVEMPAKLLSYGSKDYLLNDSITSIDTLGVKFLSELISKHPEIEDRATPVIASVEGRMLTDYHSIREAVLANGDSVGGISYFELLATTIPNINSYSIQSHNDAYLFGKVEETEQETVVTQRKLQVGEVVDGQATYATLTFLDRMDTIYVKKDTNNVVAIKSLNEEIEAHNLVKIANAEKLYNIQLGKKETKEKTTTLTKAERKRLKAEEKARKKALKEAEKQMKAEEKARKKVLKEEGIVSENATEEQPIEENVPTETNGNTSSATDANVDTDNEIAVEGTPAKENTSDETAVEEATEETNKE